MSLYIGRCPMKTFVFIDVVIIHLLFTSFYSSLLSTFKVAALVSVQIFYFWLNFLGCPTHVWFTGWRNGETVFREVFIASFPYVILPPFSAFSFSASFFLFFKPDRHMAGFPTCTPLVPCTACVALCLRPKATEMGTDLCSAPSSFLQVSVHSLVESVCFCSFSSIFTWVFLCCGQVV